MTMPAFVDEERDLVPPETLDDEVRLRTVFGQDDADEVLARLAGRLVVNRIRLCAGDLVRLEVNPCDPARGRITFRVSNSKKVATT